MENSKQDLDRLIDKYLSGEATTDEKDLLEQSYMRASMKTPPTDVSAGDADRINKIGKDSWEILMEKINRMGAKRVTLWPRIAVAASIALAVSVGGYFYYTNQHSKIQQTPTYVADIAPGKLGATLTLANGKKIRLSDAAKGQLAREAGVAISKTANGQLIYEFKALPGGAVENNLGAINTLTTAKGETYILTLPDNSKVWLNAASSLTYSAALTERRQRRVKLSGEAYFEITKDKQHPFIVETDKQEVEVLGTHFNVDSYADQPETKTTLLEGSVKVTGKSGVKIIKPGQQAILSENSIKVADVEAEDAIAWKNGYFMFDIETLESVMQKISRWYDVTVVYEDPALKSKTFLGTISRFENVSKVLNMLERTDEARFSIKGRTIYISKK